MSPLLSLLPGHLLRKLCRRNLLVRLHDLRRLLGAIKDCLLAPAGPDVERETGARSRQPVALLVLAGRSGTRIERERAVGIALERLVLRSERVAFQIVRMEEVMLVRQVDASSNADKVLRPMPMV
jgi:hypothetical protein